MSVLTLLNNMMWIIYQIYEVTVETDIKYMIIYKTLCLEYILHYVLLHTCESLARLAAMISLSLCLTIASPASHSDIVCS